MTFKDRSGTVLRWDTILAKMMYNMDVRQGWTPTVPLWLMEKIPRISQSGRDFAVSESAQNTLHPCDLLILEEPLTSPLLTTFSAWLKSLNSFYYLLAGWINNTYHPPNFLGVKTNLVNKLYNSENSETEIWDTGENIILWIRNNSQIFHLWSFFFFFKSILDTGVIHSGDKCRQE